MKKRMTAMIFATTMMFTLMGCGATEVDLASEIDASPIAESGADDDSNDAAGDAEAKETSDSEDATENTDSTASSSELSIEYKGQTFSIEDDLKTSLDKADSVGELASGYPWEMDEKNCLYYYDSENFGIATFNIKDVETVGQIYSKDPESKTAKGISPGNTKDELIAAYGEPTEIQDTFYFYKFDNYYLLFMVDNGKVSQISVNLDLEKVK